MKAQWMSRNTYRTRNRVLSSIITEVFYLHSFSPSFGIKLFNEIRILLSIDWFPQPIRNQTVPLVLRRHVTVFTKVPDSGNSFLVIIWFAIV